jgi:hypothetical protein
MDQDLCTLIQVALIWVLSLPAKSSGYFCDCVDEEETSFGNILLEV